MITKPVLRALAIAIVSAWTIQAAQGADIERLEPPFWWQGFEHRELQLLVYGTDVGTTKPVIDFPGVRIARIVTVENPNYLFVYLDIEPSAETGEFTIRFESASGVVAHTFELREKNPDPGYTRGFDSSDVVYLVTPDRFANGDPSNDYIESMGDVLDRNEPYGRHGGDLAGMKQHLDYIADMGFTSIWPNPLLENRMPRASYHGYATTDYYKVDPRFGTNDDYKAFVEAARDKGVGVIMDMIANHIGTGHWWMDDLPTDDWLNLQGEFTRTSHARTTHQDPYASQHDIRAHTDGWFAPYMPDLNQRNRLLADYLVQNSIWWIEFLGLHGIRQDTYPYPDKHFMAEWTRRIMREYPHFSIVGEEWSPNPNVVSYWQRGKQNHDGYVSDLTSVMDFPLQVAFEKSLAQAEKDHGSVWMETYEMLGNDYLYPAPLDVMIFADNHDMSRIFTQVDEDYDLYRMAIVFYLTMRGIPQIYYGTEILMSHPGTDSHGRIRSDFPGGWEGDRTSAFTGEGLGKKPREAQALVRKLLNWRKSSAVVHTGKLMQYAPVGNVYVYFRYNDDKTVMVVFNRGAEATTIDTNRFEERLRGATSASDVVSGKTHDIGKSLTLERRSVLLLEIKQQ
ncbi:MAG: glycoside hydrolase family 13 protein [Woeseiaceae bacterium]|nr:glycoside hydrolase family 13 protein [Woeseiaceae bacterium]